MRVHLRRVASIALTLGPLVLVGSQASAENNRVQFPSNLEQLVHYNTVKRGDVTENMLTTREALDAVKNGRPIPNGTHFVLADYRDGAVFRYFVMQKGNGWGTDYETSRRTGEWQFQAFKPDRTVNPTENTSRCRSCHQSQADSEYLYTFDRMRAP